MFLTEHGGGMCNSSQQTERRFTTTTTITTPPPPLLLLLLISGREGVLSILICSLVVFSDWLDESVQRHVLITGRA